VLFFSDFKQITLTDFIKNPHENFLKIRPVGAELFHADLDRLI